MESAPRIPRPRSRLARLASLARVPRGALTLLVALGAFGTVLLAAGCASSFPPPPLAPQPKEAFSEVPYPPPPARIEFVPKQPDGTAWIDGVWFWEGNQWRWTPGGWVRVPPGAAYSRWEAKRAPDGRLLFAPAAWRGKDGKALPPPELAAVANSGGASETTAAPTDAK